MKKTLLTALFIALGLLVTGCGKKPAPAPHAKPKPLPAWYLNPPKDDAHYLYGVGSAEDRDSALKAALVDMISKLGVSIESSMESSQETIGKFYANSVNKSNIKAQVSQIKINNYEVVKAERISYRQFVILVKTDKKELASGLKKEVDRKLQEMEKQFAQSKSYDRIKRYNTLKALSKEASALLPTIYIVAQLDPSFDEKSYTKRIERIRNAFEKEKNALVFNLHPTTSHAKEFTKRIADFLTQKGFRLENSKRALRIRIGVRDSIVRSSIGKIGVVKVDVKVYDGNKLVGGNTQEIKLRYNGSKEALYRRAAIEFTKELETQGLKSTLGIALAL